MFHVFPMGRMCSLRRALMLWLIPLFLLVGIVSAAISYWSYSRMVGEFMDDQMVQLGNSIAAQDETVVPPVPTRDRVHHMGAYVVQVYGADGRLLLNSWPQQNAGLQVETGFHDIPGVDCVWRVFTSAEGPGGRRVQVFQSGIFRTHVAVERAGAALAPILILLPLAILTLWGVARMMSHAVQDIGRQAALQDEHTIAELPLDRVPEEIKPLVVSFNSLLTRLRDAFATQRRQKFRQDASGVFHQRLHRSAGLDGLVKHAV